MTPYALVLLGIINALLGIVYWSMRESIHDLKMELREQKERFDDFKDRELKVINDKLDSVRKEVVDTVHRIELQLADGYVKKADLADLTRKIDKTSHRVDTLSGG